LVRKCQMFEYEIGTFRIYFERSNGYTNVSTLEKISRLFLKKKIEKTSILTLIGILVMLIIICISFLCWLIKRNG
jgi:hypothetical protein